MKIHNGTINTYITKSLLAINEQDRPRVVVPARKLKSMMEELLQFRKIEAQRQAILKVRDNIDRWVK